MALFHISKNDTNNVNKVFEANLKIPNSQFCSNTDNYYFYSTEQPINNINGAYEYCKFGDEINFVDLITYSQNNFSSFYINKKDYNKEIYISSAHFGRSKMYFLLKENDFYCSNDLRELFPYSTKKLNQSAVYSIIKFGNTPQYLNIIEDIYSIPTGYYLKINIDKLFTHNKIEYSSFIQYFKLKYTFEGGQIPVTTNILEQIMVFSAKQDVLVSISGGVDSTLINMLYNQVAQNPYPAYYLTFGDADSELPYAQAAVKNTKAELDIIKMDSKDFEEAFYYQAKHLIQPVGENSPVSMAHFFKNSIYQNKVLLDGTAADGCYGSKNYLHPIGIDSNNKTIFEKSIKEKIASFLIMNDLPFQKKFHPRDSLINDQFLAQMCHYVGPLINTLIINPAYHNDQIFKYWLAYYDLIDVSKNCKEIDSWMRYTIFKMINYAADTTNAKTYDLCGASNKMLYPFMWKDILNDQGKYTWKEKTHNNIIKYPLKKILESYMDNSFIYRKKVGLNSSEKQWMSLDQNKNLIIETISNKDGIARFMLGDSNLNKLIKQFSKNTYHDYILRIVISFACIEQWRVENKCSV